MRLLQLSNFVLACACFSVGCDNAQERAQQEYNRGALAIRNPEEPDLKQAYIHFNKAVSIDKTYIPAYLGRAYVLQQNGQTEEALAEYSRAIKVDPTAGNSLLLRGKLNRKAGHYEQAAADFREAIVLFTNAMDEDFRTAAEFEAKRRDANLQLGIGLFEEGKLAESLTEIENTLVLMEGSINPNPDVYYWRGRVYYEMCHPRDASAPVEADKLRSYYSMAIRDFGKAIWQDDKYTEAYCRRGWAQFETGNYVMAEADSLKAIALDKNRSDAYYNLARIYSMATDPAFRKGREAVQNAGIACKLTKNKSWYCLSAAGAAFAELGNFSKAQQAQQMAIKLAPAHVRSELMQRLALFQRKQPFRYRFPETTARKKVSGTLTSAK